MAAARNAARATRTERRPAARPRAVAGPALGQVIRWDRVGRLMVLVVVVFVAALYIHPLLSIWSTRGEAAQRRTDVARLQEQNDRLTRRIRALRGPSALEREARRLGMVRPGERAYVIQNLP
jgi:cell division protein FtsB